MRIALAVAVFALVACRCSFGQLVYPQGKLIYPNVVPGKAVTVQMGDTSPSALNPVYARETSHLILNCSDFLNAHPGGSIRWYQRVRKGNRQELLDTEPFKLMPFDKDAEGAGPPSGPFHTIVEIKQTTLSADAASGNSGFYTCEVCATADKSHVQKCYNATIDVRVTRSPPETFSIVSPRCVTEQDIANPAADAFRLTCDVVNKNQYTVEFELYFNGSRIVDRAKLTLNQFAMDKMYQNYLLPSNIAGELFVVFNLPNEFNALGTYQCVGYSIWGTSNSTLTYSICDTEPQIPKCPFTHVVADLPSVPIGCDVCIQFGSRVKLDCTAQLGPHYSEKTLKYNWLYANSGLSTGITSPTYTVNGMGQYTCTVTNSGFTVQNTSNVFLYVKSSPSVTITSSTLRGDPTGCKRLKPGTTIPAESLCPFVGEMLTIVCTGDGVMVLKDGVNQGVSTLVHVVNSTADAGNYSCGNGGPCDNAQPTKSVVVYSPAQIDLQSNIGAAANTFAASRAYSPTIVTDGTAVTLTCPTSGINEPSTHWEYIAPQDGDTAGSTALPQGVIETLTTANGEVTSTLTFTFNASYTGTFVCVTSNAAGDDQGFVVLRPEETYSWTIDNWSLCNIDCEQGIRTRRVICRSNWDGSAVADTLCSGTPPIRQEKCNNVSCLLFQPVWQGTEWSGCSQDCGGYRTRLVVCIIPQTQRVVSNDLCITSATSGPRPPTTEFCENKCCVEDTYPEFCQQYVKGTDLCLQDRYKQICCCACGLKIKP